MGDLGPSGGRGPQGRRRAALVSLALGLLLATLPAVALADATGGLWVTQRDGSDTANVQAITIGSSDDLLTGPLSAGIGGDESYGIAVTPINE